MKILKTLLAFVLVASVQSCAGAPAYGQQSEASIVRIRSDIGSGSGTFIGDGKVLTAAHVIGESVTVFVRTQDGTTSEATVISKDSDKDVAILKLIDPLTLPKANVACRVPLVGEMLEGIGHPLVFTYVHVWGRVSSTTTSTKDLRLGLEESVLVDMVVVPGMSGGPVFDTAGDIVGIMVATLKLEDGVVAIALIVPGSAICGVMQQ